VNLGQFLPSLCTTLHYTRLVNLVQFLPSLYTTLHYTRRVNLGQFLLPLRYTTLHTPGESSSIPPPSALHYTIHAG